MEDTTMRLHALPTEILLQISGELSLRTIIRLGATCRQLRRIVFDLIPHTGSNLSPSSLYFAVLRQDNDSFTKLCKGHQGKLLDHDAIDCLSKSRFSAANQELLAIQDCLLASVYLLVVTQAETGQQWWEPLTHLASDLVSSTSAFFRQSFVIGQDFQLTPDVDQFPSRHIIEDALLKKRYTALQHLYHPTREAVFKFVRNYDLSKFFVQLCMTPTTETWTTSDRKTAISLLAHVCSTSSTSIDLASGFYVQTSSDDDSDSDSDDELPTDHLHPLDALISTNDFELIVSVILRHASSARHPPFRIHTRRILDSLLADGNRDLFQLVMKSYLIAMAYHTPTRSRNLEYLIECPPTIAHQLDQLCDTYATHGISKLDCSTFLHLLNETTFTTQMVPWLLGQCPSSPHAHLRIEWLLNHTHLHFATLHYLPFNSCNLQSRQCFQLILDRIPIDFACAGMHKQQDFEPRTLGRSPPFFCARCDSIAEACVPRYFEPHLARFASRIWVVSVDPIPEAQLRDEARAVAALMAEVPVKKDARSWADYYGLVLRARIEEEEARWSCDGLPQSGHGTDGADSGAEILWVSSPGSFKVNVVDLELVAREMLSYCVFGEIVSLAQEALSAGTLTFMFDEYWVDELSKSHDELKGCVEDSPGCAEEMAELKRLIRFVQHHGLWDGSARKSSQFVRLLACAVE